MIALISSTPRSSQSLDETRHKARNTIVLAQLDILATQPRSRPAISGVLAALAATLVAAVSSPAMAAPMNLITNGTFTPTTQTETIFNNGSGNAEEGENIVGSPTGYGWTIGSCNPGYNPAGNCNGSATPAFDFQFLSTSYNNSGAGAGVLYNGSSVIYNTSNGPGVFTQGGTTYNYAVGVDSANLEAPITQLVTGLIVGDVYVLTFAQASTQWQSAANPSLGFQGNWQVGFCTSLAAASVNGGACATSVASNTMLNPAGGYTNWQGQTLYLTATSSSEYLSFLTNTPSTGQPPFLLLTDVSLSQMVAEPDSLTMLAGAMGGLLLLRRRRAA